MLYYPCLIYLALFIFLLGFRTNQQQHLTVFLLIPLNFQMMYLLYIVACLIMMHSILR
jgi:hypothetical protein